MSVRSRLATGLTGVAATAAVVRRDRVGGCEASAFHMLNDLPDSLYPGVWLVMQGGALGAAPAAAVVARLSGRPELARHLLLSGCAAWTAAKVVKVLVQRPRPAVLVPGTRCRGDAATGLGFVSGHAAVAVALAAGAVPQLGPRGRAAVAVAVPAIAAARVYVGAHLPLDAVGGAALGLAADAAVSAVLSVSADRVSRPCRSSTSCPSAS